MISIGLRITNPWKERFDNIYNTSGRTPWENKFWEFQAMRTSDILVADLDISTRCDHAGIKLGLGLFGYTIDLSFYDSRHWNHEAGRYYIYDDAGKAS